MCLGIHYAHTLLYPSCTWTMLGTVFTNDTSAMEKSCIVLMVFQNQFHHLHCVICQAERCHLHHGCQPTLELSSPSSYKNVVSVHHHQTPTLTGSEFQGWKFSAYINCHTMRVFLLSLPLHINLSPK
jgi:hypothetical protein